jgi:hypothetical protein
MAESKYLKKTQGNGASTVLSSSITNADTAAPLTSDTAFDGEGMLLLDEGQATEEFAYGTGKVGSSITILADDRGLEGGSAQAHADTATVKGVVTSGMWNNLITAVSKLIKPTDGTLQITGTATATDILDEDNMASNSATALATQQSIKSYTDNYGNINSIYRQAIINGNFDVWQRGTSIAWASDTYTSDRWFFNYGAAVTGTVSRQDGTAVSGSLYCARVQRTAGQGAVATNFTHSIESTDSIKFRGKKVTLSFYARKGADYSATSDYLVANVKTGTGTDEKADRYTGSATVGTTNAVLTTSWQRFTITTTSVLADTVTEMGIVFASSFKGTAGAADYYEITQVQLCAGDVALPFMPKSFEEELRACQRYCEMIRGSGANSESFGVGYFRTTETGYVYQPFTVKKRTNSPTAIYSAADTFSIGYGGGGGGVLSAIQTFAITGFGVRILITQTGGSFTAGQCLMLTSDGTDDPYILVENEL